VKEFTFDLSTIFQQFSFIMKTLLQVALKFQPLTLPVKMFGPFWSVWCKIALAEVGLSHDDAKPLSF
jgi:hypothetical protein